MNKLFRIEWSQYAIEDREIVFDYIEQENPQAAVSVDEKISSQVQQLIEFPERGRSGRVEGTRELVINRTSYIAAYCIKGNVVLILRILHSSQLWPEKIEG